MAIDISALTPVKAAPIKRHTERGSKDLGPNPFLDHDWEFSIRASYDNAEAYAIPFPGAVEKLPATRGANKGEPIDKVTGQAADAIALIRNAAAVEGLGSSVRWVDNGDGTVTVTYQGQKRKNTKAKTEANIPPIEPESESVPEAETVEEPKLPTRRGRR